MRARPPDAQMMMMIRIVGSIKKIGYIKKLILYGYRDCMSIISANFSLTHWAYVVPNSVNTYTITSTRFIKSFTLINICSKQESKVLCCSRSDVFSW